MLQKIAGNFGLSYGSQALSGEDFGAQTDEDILVCADASVHRQTSRSQVVVLSQKPESSAQALAEHSGFQARDALILVSRLYESAWSAIAAGARCFWAEDFLRNPIPTLESFLQALDISTSAGISSDVATHFYSAMRNLSHTEPLQVVVAPFRGALAMYDGTSGPRNVEAWWDRSVFRWGDVPELECPELIDVTGPVRMLTFGPFITLPAGRWRAELHFDVCSDAARRFYLVEFGAGADLSRRHIRLAEVTDESLSVEHVFTEAAPAEVRFWVARAAFHGQLKFRGVRILGFSGDTR